MHVSIDRTFCNIFSDKNCGTVALILQYNLKPCVLDHFPARQFIWGPGFSLDITGSLKHPEDNLLL